MAVVVDVFNMIRFILKWMQDQTGSQWRSRNICLDACVPGRPGNSVCKRVLDSLQFFNVCVINIIEQGVTMNSLFNF